MKTAKILGFIFGILVAVQFVGAKIIQGVVSDTIDSLTENYQDMTAVPIIIIDKQSNLFSTDIEYGVNIPDHMSDKIEKELDYTFPEKDGQKYFSVSTSISHGPVVFNNGIHLTVAYTAGSFSLEKVMNTPIAEKMMEKHADDEELQESMEMLMKFSDALTVDYEFEIQFDGTIYSTSSIAGGTVTLDDVNTVVTIPALKGSSIIDLAANHIIGNTNTTGDFQIEMMETDNQKGIIKLSGINVTAHSKAVESNLWLSSFDIEADSLKIQVSQPGKPAVDVNFGTMKYQFGMDMDDDSTIKTKALQTIDDFAVSVDNQVLDFDTFTMDIAIEKLPIAIMKQYDEFNKMTYKAFFNGDIFDPRKARIYEELHAQKMIALIEDTIAAKPVLNISDISMVKDGHRFQSDMVISLGDDFQLGAPDMMMHVNGTGSITFDRLFVESFAPFVAASDPRMTEEQFIQMFKMQMDQMLQLGFFEQDGDSFISKLGIANGYFTMKDKPVSPLP